MPRIVKSQDTREIHAQWWAEGETCIVKRLSFADRNRMNTMLYRSIGKEAVEAIRNADAELPDDALQDTFMARLVVGIESMTDPDGEPLDVTPEIVASLDDRDAQFILDAINDLNPQLTETAGETDNFPRRSGSSSEDGIDAAA